MFLGAIMFCVFTGTSILTAFGLLSLGILSPGPIVARLSKLGLMEGTVKEKEVSVLKEEAETEAKALEAVKSATPNRIYLAGYRTASAKSKIMIYRALVTTLLVFAAILGANLQHLPWASSLLLAGCAFALGWHLFFHLWLSAKIETRRKDVAINLADTMDLLVICLEAGLSFEAALLKVAKEQKRYSRILSDELLYTNREILAGKSRHDALHSLSVRCGNQANLRSLIAIIIQAEKFGASLANVLRIQADSLRFTRSQDIKESIQKVPIKLLFPLIFCILPTLFIVSIGPAGIYLYDALMQVVE